MVSTGLQMAKVLLYLFDTQVKDLTPLAGLASLKVLILVSTPVSDVKPLAGLTNLELLHLLAMPVSQEDSEMLRKALPGCRIRWSEHPKS